MTIEEYSKQESIHGVNPFEALRDEFTKINIRRKYKWIVDSVNGTLRRAIKQTLDPELLDRLYASAKLIDDADEKAEILSNDEKSNRRVLLKATSRYVNPLEYLEYAESSAEGASNSDITDKVNALRAMEPEAGILYLKDKRLVMSIRTAKAQKEICNNVSNWCINDWAWGSYAGKYPDALQINIYDFNLPVTDLNFTIGTTIHGNQVFSCSNKSNLTNEIKSQDPKKHFTLLGYPEDLVNTDRKSVV
jgi:hypothetical protein